MKSTFFAILILLSSSAAFADSPPSAGLTYHCTYVLLQQISPGSELVLLPDSKVLEGDIALYGSKYDAYGIGAVIASVTKADGSSTFTLKEEAHRA